MSFEFDPGPISIVEQLLMESDARSAAALDTTDEDRRRILEYEADALRRDEKNDLHRT